MFVGREKELARLNSAFDEVGAGSSKVLGVVGAAGIGKSTLVREFAARASQGGNPVIWSHLHEGVEYPLYRLWAHVFREWKRAADGNARLHPEVDALLGIDRSSAARQTVRPHPQTANRTELHSLIVDALHSISSPVPHILILENVHLADAGSLNVLGSLAERRTGSQLFVLFTARDNVAGDGLDALFDAADVIVLDGLDPEATAALLSSGVQAFPTSLAQLVHQHTRGLPIYVSEVTKLLRSESERAAELVSDPRFWSGTVAERILPLVERRIHSLGRERIRILSVGSLLDPEFAVDEVVELCTDVAPDAIYDAVRAASDLGIVEPVKGAHERMVFSHPLVRDALQTLLPAHEAAEFRSRRANKLERDFGLTAPEHALELSAVFLRGDYPADLGKGVSYAILAGEHALEWYGWERSYRIFTMLLDDFAAMLDADQAARVNAGIGTALCRIGRRYESVAYFERAFRRYEDAGDIDAMIHIAVQPIDVEFGEHSHFTFVERAVRQVAKSHPMYEALMLIYGVGLFDVRGEYRRAEIELEDLARYAASRGNADMETRILPAYAYVELQLSRTDLATEICNQVLTRVESRPDKYPESHACFVLAQAYTIQGRIDTALVYAMRSRDAVRHLHDVLLTCTGIAQVARIAMRRGDWPLVRDQLEEGFSLDRENPFMLTIGTNVEYQCGRIDAGDEYLRRLMRIVAAIPAGQSLTYVSFCLLVVTRVFVTGEHLYYHEAKEIAARIAESVSHPAIEIRALVALACFAFFEGDRQTASALVRRFDSFRWYELIRNYRVLRARGLLASVCESGSEAASCFDQALDDCRKIGDRMGFAWTSVLYGEQVLDGRCHGGLQRGRRLIDSARIIARELGIVPLEDRAQRLLETAAPESSDDPHAGTSALSPREVEILRLVAEGMSDKEIATLLSISVHTASNHVRRSARKLSARNRLDAVRRAQAGGLL